MVNVRRLFSSVYMFHKEPFVSTLQVLIETLKQLGARVRWATCNIYSTQVSGEVLINETFQAPESWKKTKK